MTRAITFFALYLLSIVLTACHHKDAQSSSGVIFAQTQSSLIPYKKQLLIISNASQRMRPYIVGAKEWTPLLTAYQNMQIPEVDLYRPKALAMNRILFSAQVNGKLPFEIYLYDPKAPSLYNLTKTKTRDEGDICVSPTGNTFSFRSGRTQEVRYTNDPYLAFTSHSAPPFARCFWPDEKTLIGITKPYGLSHSFFICEVSKYTFSCAPSRALDEILYLTSFFRSGEQFGFIGIGKDGGFRRPFSFDKELHPSPLPNQPRKGDTLNVHYYGTRIGFQSRYQMYAPDHSALAPKSHWMNVFRTTEVQGNIYGIVSSQRHPKLPARLIDGEWKLLPYQNYPAPTDPPTVREIWFQSPETETKHQAFLFEKNKTKQVIVWLHGGPKENVSPRYNPYYHALTSMGFSVLALNYPGSTGRGWKYESRFQQEDISRALHALYPVLQREGFNVVIPWSVSTGFSVLKIWANSDLPISGAISQAAAASPYRRQELREVLERRHIPLFSIRGKFDRASGGEVDYLYSGAHDITRKDQFQLLLKKIKGFLQNSVLDNHS